GKIHICNLEGRIAEVEPGWRVTADFSHADLHETTVAQRQRLLDRANHENARRAVGESHCSRGEGTKHVNDCDHSGRMRCAIEQTANYNLRRSGTHPLTSRISFAQRSNTGSVASAFSAGRLTLTRATPRSR